ncbi:MAG: phosphohydrolase [Firmicutes bacterium HGW-Firmicutes-15]|nr:MAG: phosphohydrolase [Firmicutes bacterium HGW-Firmicutes-15]
MDNLLNNFSIEDMEKIFKASSMAAEGHKYQKLLGSGIASASHPMSVGIILARIGASPDVVIAGLLHHILRGTIVSPYEIRAQFGQSVLDIIKECSAGSESSNWEDRKINRIRVLKEASPEAWLVTCADKVHSASSMLAEYKIQGENLWKHYERGRDKQKWYYESIVEALEKGKECYPLLYTRLEDIVRSLFPD